MAAPGKDDEGMSAAFSSTQERVRRREVRKVEPKVILTRFLSRETYRIAPSYDVQSPATGRILRFPDPLELCPVSCEERRRTSRIHGSMVVAASSCRQQAGRADSS